jgi:hypothetical protein
MDKPYIVDFGEGEERWQDAELGKRYMAQVDADFKKEEEYKRTLSGYQGLSRDFFLRQAKEKYRAEIIHRYLDSNPNTPTFEVDDDDIASTYNSRVRSHFNLGDKDTFTSSHQNYGLALRGVDALQRGEEGEPYVGSLDNLYNRKTLEENKAWEAARAKIPQTAPDAVSRPTSPSRLQSLGVFGQKIDPNVPMFLQKANPHIPWGVNHPLRKAYREHILTRQADSIREDYEYDAMEKLNNPNYLESDLYKEGDTAGEPWHHLKDTADEVKKWGYTPYLIDKMQTLRQQELLKLESLDE